MGDEATIAVGDVLDKKYEITDILGEGAMGVVYLAIHKRLQRTVALKTLRAEIAGDPELIERFEREARAASAIGHPNIVQVYDAGGEPGGVPYLVMENLAGRSMGELLHEEGPLSVERTRDLVLQLLAGLGAAHAAGIVHRDLKPDNIFVTRDGAGSEVVKILDFGISKILDVADPAIAGDSSSTRAGTVMGTPLYMSPEQASGVRDLDHRADLWAVVCVLYECLSGATPFEGENYNQILAAVLRGEFMSLKQRCPSVSGELNDLIQRGLKLNRDDRFEDAAALSAALQAVPTAPAAADKGQDKDMLAAFDNLADRFLAQEEADSVDTPIPEPGGVPTPPPPVGDAMFAPPDAAEDLSLSLDVDEPRLTPAPTIPLSEPKTPRPTKSKPAQIVTRSEPKSGGTFLKIMLLVFVLAAGGAGYRYYTYGYLLKPDPPKLAQLELQVVPKDARVYLDGDLKSERTLSLVNGESYTLRVKADGKLTMQAKMDAKAGTTLHAAVHLGNTIAKIDRELAGDPSFAAGEMPTQALIDAALSKLEGYADCGARLNKALSAASQSDTPADKTEALPSSLTDECVMALGVLIGEEPALDGLDAASVTLQDATSDLNQAVHKLASSEGAKSRIIRARKAELAKAMRSAERATATWRDAMNSARAYWITMDASQVSAREGKSQHALLRSLVVASDHWLRAHLAGLPAKSEREHMEGVFAAVSEAASGQPELFSKTGGAAFLQALRPIIDEESAEDALFWHNQAVDVFNQLLLPIPIEVKK